VDKSDAAEGVVLDTSVPWELKTCCEVDAALPDTMKVEARELVLGDNEELLLLIDDSCIDVNTAGKLVVDSSLGLDGLLPV
jgi:hypothetical protein